MSRQLAYTVHVRQTEPVDAKRPELGNNVVREELFLAGSTLPAWASSLVGDHVYGDNADDGQSAADPTDVDGDGRDDTDPEKPAGNASLEAWQEYATLKGVDVEGKSRDEIRDGFAA